MRRAVGESEARARVAATPLSDEGPIEVRPVRSRRELRAFIRLPWRLYQGAANWVPPLISERKRFLDKRRNAFFEHAEAEYFLAWRRGTPVGRITAHVDHRFNEFQNNRWECSGSSSARTHRRPPERYWTPPSSGCEREAETA